MLKWIYRLFFPKCNTHLWEVKGKWMDINGAFTVKFKCNHCKIEEYKTFRKGEVVIYDPTP